MSSVAPLDLPRRPTPVVAALLGAAVAWAVAVAPAAAQTPAAPRPARAPRPPCGGGWPDAGTPSEAAAPARTAARPSLTPRGYLGLRLGEVSDVRWSDADGRLVRYCAYPVVMSVEPASPAEQAGLEAGDTLVAYGGRDLVRDGPVPLDRLLSPGETLRVRVRRGGRTITRPVVVGRRPAPASWAWRTERDAPRVASRPAPLPPLPSLPPLRPAVPLRVQLDGFDAYAPGVAWPSGETDDRDDRGDRRVQVRVLADGRHRVLAGRLGAALARADSAPAPAPWVTFFPNGPGAWTQVGPEGAAYGVAYAGPSALAGMQVIALNDDLREVLAVQTRVPADSAHNVPVRGVFVLKVLPGTPAAESGLRGGDVVTAAQGRPVETPAALQRVLAGRALSADRVERRAVALRVARAGAMREVTLRW